MKSLIIFLNMIQKVEDPNTPNSLFPKSKRIYLEGKANDIRVPMREIALTDTNLPNGAKEKNEPVRVYDTSGPWGDDSFHGDVKKGLPKLRSEWILKRGDVETISGRDVKPGDNGFLSERHDQRTRERSQELPDFDRSKISVLRAKSPTPLPSYNTQGKES